MINKSDIISPYVLDNCNPIHTGKLLKKIIINEEIWQTRVAILDKEKLQDIYFDFHNKIDLERCFFKGKVSKVLPGIQTAFVNIGQPKAGFLHINEVDRTLAAKKIFIDTEEIQEREDITRIVKHAMDIGKIFKEGDEILVQAIKEPIYEKGAKLTTCFTLPGKFVVLMPNIPQIGISKKIESRTERIRLKDLIQKKLPKGMGAIVRTTAENRPEKDMQKDLSFLISTWKSITKKSERAKPGDKIHEDIPVSLRTVRDHLDNEIAAVIVDNVETQKSVIRFVKNFTPEQSQKIFLYNDHIPIFDKFNIEKQIEEALQKKVPLKSGGSLIIESTEAMCVVDVNTGRYTGKGKLEETIFETNIEAAEEIVRQLRLRNIGGLIVIDFIDMTSASNKQKLSRFLEKTLKEKDKYQSVMLKVSEFGLVQMTRKRSGKTLVQQLMNVCPTCNAHGYIKSRSTISFDILKHFKNQVESEGCKNSIILVVSTKIFDYLIHNEFQALLLLEEELHCKIILESNDEFEESEFSVKKID